LDSGNECDGYVLNFRQVTEIGLSGGGTNTSDLRSATYEDDKLAFLSYDEEHHAITLRYLAREIANVMTNSEIDLALAARPPTQLLTQRGKVAGCRKDPLRQASLCLWEGLFIAFRSPFRFRASPKPSTPHTREILALAFPDPADKGG